MLTAIFIVFAQLGDIEMHLELERNAKHGCCGKLYKDLMLWLHTKTGKNFQVARTFGQWKGTAQKQAYMRKRMRDSLSTLLMRQERAGLTAWIETYEETRDMLKKMRKVLKRLTLGAESRCWNSWHEKAVEWRHRKDKLAAFLARSSPEGRAKLHGLNLFKAHKASRDKIRRALAGFSSHQYLGAWNKWAGVCKDAHRQRDKMKAVLTRMSPEGRSMLKAIEKFQEIQRAAHAMRRAVLGFTLAGPRKAFNTWANYGNRRTQAYQSTVWLAAQRGHRVAALQEMLSSLDSSLVADLIRATDELGMTPLLWAAKRGFADVAEVLLAFGADAEEVISAQDAEGSTALHHAARKAHNDVVSLLLKSGAPINAVNHDQSTPLHWAARKNNTQAISMLLENGADLESKNKWGATPFDNAKFAEHMGSIALLATDAATKKAAETKLNLERKLRPTDEERQAKLASLAADALAAREKNKKRLEESKAVKTERETAAKQSAQAERWRRTADRALAGILDPLKASKSSGGGPPGGSSPFGSAGIFGGGGGGGGSNEESEEIKALAAAIQEAKDAGNGEIKGAPAERLRAAEIKLEELRAEEAERMASRSPSGTQRGKHSQRAPAESPVERTMRRQQLAMKMASKGL